MKLDVLSVKRYEQEASGRSNPSSVRVQVRQQRYSYRKQTAVGKGAQRRFGRLTSDAAIDRLGGPVLKDQVALWELNKRSRIFRRNTGRVGGSGHVTSEGDLRGRVKPGRDGRELGARGRRCDRTIACLFDLLLHGE